WCRARARAARPGPRQRAPCSEPRARPARCLAPCRAREPSSLARRQLRLGRCRICVDDVALGGDCSEIAADVEERPAGVRLDRVVPRGWIGTQPFRCCHWISRSTASPCVFVVMFVLPFSEPVNYGGIIPLVVAVVFPLFRL